MTGCSAGLGRSVHRAARRVPSVLAVARAATLATRDSQIPSRIVVLAISSLSCARMFE